MSNIETAPPHKGYDEQLVTEKGKAVRSLIQENLLDERYATTQRGLKNRHVQLMALGGTIGTGKAGSKYQWCIALTFQRPFRVIRPIIGDRRPCFPSAGISFYLCYGLRTCNCHR
jgi:hypothetical protein